MSLADELAQVECAEDLFARFGVDFDPRVMVVHRLRVLKRFGVEVRRMETQGPPISEAERERLYRQALIEAQAQFANPTRSAEPLLPGFDPSLVQIRRHYSGA
jgi:hypothetical protein